jgi:tetrapyrrole methylase family protein / MazG family protein
VQQHHNNTLLHPLVRAALNAAGLEAHSGCQQVTGAYLRDHYHPRVEVELSLIITDFGVDDLAQMQAVLQNGYPAAHPIVMLSSASGEDASTFHTTLQALTTLEPAAGINLLCVPPLPAGSSFSALQAIVAHLRSPAGCPWDRKQTLLTMRHDLLGECAEVIEAIDLDSTIDNGPHIAEEIGDLLMAAVLIIQIATDEGRFQMAHVMQNIVAKLIRRHPHVFGDVAVDGVEHVVANWDAIKAQEKAAKGQSQLHPLDGVPAALPALEKARELQSKAAKAGWLDRAAVAQANPIAPLSQPATITEESLGELLWSIVALAHNAGLNAEDALRSYTVHFRSRTVGQ